MKIFPVGGCIGLASYLFPDATLTKNIIEADIALFSGGSDVSPYLYGDEAHPFTGNDPSRDAMEHLVFNNAKHYGVSCVGVCRGSQFLNVMNGGKLYQHVYGHALYGTHEAKAFDGRSLQITSTHHQMSRVTDKAEVFLWADGLSKANGYEKTSKQNTDKEALEVEGFFYPETKSLGFQYHPEYMDKDSEGYLFFQEMVEKYLGVK